MTEALIDLLSQLTPPMQVHTQGIIYVPLREQFEGNLLSKETENIALLNPWTASETITEFLSAVH